MVSSLNQDNPLIWPESMPSWLRPTVIQKRVEQSTNDESPSVSEQSEVSQRALSPFDTEMNPGSLETFRNIRVTGPLNDQSLTGGLLPNHRNGVHNVSHQNPNRVRFCTGLQDTDVESSYNVMFPTLSSESNSPSEYSMDMTAEHVVSVISDHDWIISHGDKLVIKTICKAVGPGGSYRKRMARLRYGFRKLDPKLKLPYSLLREMLGLSLSTVKRAVTISSNTEELKSALRSEALSV